MNEFVVEKVVVSDWGGFGEDLTAPDGHAAVDGLITWLHLSGATGALIAAELEYSRGLGRDIRDVDQVMIPRVDE